jgi:hypothetical protein
LVARVWNNVALLGGGFTGSQLTTTPFVFLRETRMDLGGSLVNNDGFETLESRFSMIFYLKVDSTRFFYRAFSLAPDLLYS